MAAGLTELGKQIAELKVKTERTAAGLTELGKQIAELKVKTERMKNVEKRLDDLTYTTMGKFLALAETALLFNYESLVRDLRSYASQYETDLAKIEEERKQIL